MYSRSTRFFNIPVMANGDILTQQSEARQMTLIDNMLQFATYGVANCIIEQGLYSFSANDNLCQMNLRPFNGITLMGLLNRRLLLSERRLSSPQFTMDGKNYIYVKYEGNQDTITSNSKSTIISNETKFSIVVSKNNTFEEDIYMLLCTVDFSNSSSTSIPVILDDKIAWVNEDNKIYAKNLLAHSKDNTNPHGKTLYQNNIKFHHLSTDFVSGDTKLNLPVYGAIYQDIISQGKDQITVISLPSGFKPMFVTVTPTTPSIGYITVKYGQDLPKQALGQVIPDTDYVLVNGDEGQKIWIENDGVAGQKIHVKIQVEQMIQFSEQKEV